MLDSHFVREHLEEVKTNCRNRNVKADVDRVVQLDDERKRLIQETQTLQQKQNEVSAFFALVGRDEFKKNELMRKGRELREQVANLQKQMQQIEVEERAILLTIPNMS